MQYKGHTGFSLSRATPPSIKDCIMYCCAGTGNVTTQIPTKLREAKPQQPSEAQISRSYSVWGRFQHPNMNHYHRTVELCEICKTFHWSVWKKWCKAGFNISLVIHLWLFIFTFPYSLFCLRRTKSIIYLIYTKFSFYRSQN